MKKHYTLTAEQLDFVSFMNERAATSPKLKKRYENCLDTLNKTESDSGTTHCHSPQKMIEFLSLFSRDDRFKWYTHRWDMSSQFRIEEIINKQAVDKYVLNAMAYPKESGPVVNESTYNQVWNFINFMNTGRDKFTWKNIKFENISYGWHSIIDLSKQKPEIPVENLKLDNGRQFKDYVRMFKASIEFRTDLKDEDRFSELIWNCINSWLPKDFEVVFSSEFDELGYDLNVYCDVVGILSAINTICNWIIAHKAISSRVNIDLIKDNQYYVLEITHKHSYFNNIEKLQNPSGDFDSLRKRLFSVCDFSMAGDFVIDGQRCGSLIVNALDNKTISRGNVLSPCKITTTPTQTGGVKYKLKIYKR